MPNTIDLSPTERIAIVAHHLSIGEQLSTADVASLTGLSRCGAWEMLDKLSRVLPIAQDRTKDNGSVWYIISDFSIR